MCSPRRRSPSSARISTRTASACLTFSMCRSQGGGQINGRGVGVGHPRRAGARACAHAEPDAPADPARNALARERASNCARNWRGKSVSTQRTQRIRSSALRASMSLCAQHAGAIRLHAWQPRAGLCARRRDRRAHRRRSRWRCIANRAAVSEPVPPALCGRRVRASVRAGLRQDRKRSRGPKPRGKRRRKR